MSPKITSYVLCIDDGGYPESLEVRRIYPVLPDDKAAAREYVRIIGWTVAAYLNPIKDFFPRSLSGGVIGSLTAPLISIVRFACDETSQQHYLCCPGCVHDHLRCRKSILSDDPCERSRAIVPAVTYPSRTG